MTKRVTAKHGLIMGRITISVCVSKGSN